MWWFAMLSRNREGHRSPHRQVKQSRWQMNALQLKQKSSRLGEPRLFTVPVNLILCHFEDVHDKTILHLAEDIHDPAL
jgi:hypothetical protein